MLINRRYCGTTSDYCNSPNCQFQYGPGCDANKRPAGASTSTIPRPHIGSIPYGGVNTAGIQHCTKTGVIAFTYDDGPYLYTKDLVDLLDSYGAKATFFISKVPEVILSKLELTEYSWQQYRQRRDR